MPAPVRIIRPGLVALAAAVAALAPSTASAAGIIPSDPYFAKQWDLQPDAALHAPEAWEASRGKGVVVAILDTGVDMTQPDLQGALWTNPGEIPGNGKDDDHDGYVDDVHGVDIVNNDGDPADDEGHGTHVAGIIAARMDGEGVVGVAPEATIMPVKVLGSDRSGTTTDLATGIRYAIAHGANIINTSVNGDQRDPDLDAAIKAANDAGVTIVASAGNNGRNLDSQPSWPASSSSPNVLAVAATDSTLNLASFSNFGAGSVDLAAPGVSIVSDRNGGGVEGRSGTSMAAPATAGALALVESARPDLSPAAARDALLSSVDKPSFLAGLLGSSGELDAAAALHKILPDSAFVAPSGGDTTATAATARPTLVLRVRRRASDHSGRRKVLLTWSVRGDASAIKGFRLSGPDGRTLARPSRVRRGAWVRVGRTTVRLTAVDASGRTLARKSIRVA